MSTYNINDFTNLKENAEQSEVNSMINNTVKNMKPSEDVEIFSKILFGKDTSKYGDRVDKTMDKVKMVAKAASEGNTKAKAEINSIVTVSIQQPLMQRLNINNALGNTKTVGMDEELRYEYYQLQASELSRIQASSGSFTFPSVKKRTGIAETQTATGGIVIDQRELASGAVDGLSQAAEQVITDINNQMIFSNINALRNTIKNATTLKNYAEGITEANVDAVRIKARRFGTGVTITGDYSAVSKLGDLSGFKINSATATEVRFPQSVMDEVIKTGLLSNYKGAPVVEIPNTYNVTALNTAGTFYKPYLPTTDLWFIPQGQMTPLQIVMRGGLTSMTANDINSRSEVTRYDLEYGNYVVKEYIPFLGLIYDESLAE